MVFEYTDYRAFIKGVLADRIAKNPRYSMRAMARALSVSPALLCQITNGQRNLTVLNAVRFSTKLGLSAKESDYFCSLVQYQDAKHAETKALLLEKLNSLREHRGRVHSLPLDAFKAMSEWHHFAIIEALRLRGFRPTPRRLAAKLGIAPVVAEDALERLHRLNLIRPTDDGGYRPTHGLLRVESRERSQALQTFHRQLLELATASLVAQSPDERHFGTETFALDPAQIPEAQKRINEFLDEMARFFDRGKNPTEVYTLGVQMFRLSRKEEA